MERIAARRRMIIAAAYAYFTLPICIYLVGWLKPAISIPLALLFVYGTVVATLRFDTKGLQTLPITAKQAVVVSLVLFAWVLLGGVGGYVWQNRYDHVLRNAVFQDLVNFDWPVYSAATGKTLSYYLGFWMPAALVGKALGMEAGYAFQLAWALLGAGLAFCLMSYLLKKFSLITLLVFIFFSGLDIIPYLVNAFQNGFPDFRETGYFVHMEVQFIVFNSSSNTTMLVWMYNYAIPFWVGYMLLLLQKSNRSLWFTYSLLALFAPIPMVGALPAAVYLTFRNEGITPRNFRRKAGSFFRNLFTVQNVAGVAQAGIVALYLGTNDSAKKIGMLPVDGASVAWYLYFFMVEFGVYLLWLYPSWTKNRLCIVLICSTMAFSFVEMGGSYDFAWRTTVPLMLFLMIFILNKLLQKPRRLKKPVLALLILTLLLGAVTPALELGRSAYNTAVILIERHSPGTYAEGTYEYNVSREPLRNDWIASFVEIEGDEYTEVIHNFIGTYNEDDFFNRYLRKSR